MITLQLAASINVPTNRVITKLGCRTLAYTLFLTAVATLAGGFSIVPVTGGWVMQDGSLCIEDILQVQVLTSDGTTAVAVQEVVREYAGTLLALGEEAVFMVLAGDTVLATSQDYTAQQAA